ncbi:MAG: alpha/beta hydrolase [Candidatus Thorarchaeota archaeon]|nr:MAG: alpha/beta hydrolase [Candidatus Thorarchaeota archaeon]
MARLVTKSLETEFGTIVYYSHMIPTQPIVNLYIHGLGDNRKWFLKHFATYSLDKFSWIIPDLLGHGNSSKSDKAEAYTMEQQAKYLVAILERENVKQLSLLAHSMGGAIAVSLIELLYHKSVTFAKPRLLLYLEGNLDAGDAFFSSLFAKMTFAEFRQEFDSICRKIQGDSEEEHMIDFISAFRKAGSFTIWASSQDLAPVSVMGNLLNRLLVHRDFDCYFIYGEKNKGTLSSENLVRDAQLPLLFIPNAGHGLHTENPSYFWMIVGDLIQKKNIEVGK